MATLLALMPNDLLVVQKHLVYGHSELWLISQINLATVGQVQHIHAGPNITFVTKVVQITLDLSKGR